MQKNALIQIAERAEPAECTGEKDNPGEIAEQEIVQPTVFSRIFAGKPNRDDEGSQRDPTEPALLKRRKTKSGERTS